VSPVLKRSIVIEGHKTSVSLEDEFWESFKEIAEERGMTVTAMIGAIDDDRNMPTYRQRSDFLCLAPIAISSPPGIAVERCPKLAIRSIGVGERKKLAHLLTN
jgi:Ribbon-helix-helix domain